jgi:hypothetical protein
MIDNVAQLCPIGATFAPSAGYFSLTNKQTSWEYPKSMEWLGFNPNSFAMMGTLSFDCWDYYEEQVSANEDETGTNEDEEQVASANEDETGTNEDEEQVSANEDETGTNEDEEEVSANEDESSSGFVNLLNVPVAFVSFGVLVFNLQA